MEEIKKIQEPRLWDEPKYNWKSIPSRKKDLLREFVGFFCENCHQSEKKVGKLQIHRIQRGSEGGKYILRNILVICSACHKKIHYGEF
jgi:hypothetical protein